MSLLRTSTAILAATSVLTSASAATSEPCVTETEGAAIMASMMPDLINGLGEKCLAHLPANSFLVQNGKTLAARYTVLADQRWPTAKLAFGRMTGEPELADKLPDQYFRPMLGSMVGSELLKSVKPQDCSGANRIVESLAPLPPENVAHLIGAIRVFAQRDDDSKGFKICKA